VEGEVPSSDGRSRAALPNRWVRCEMFAGAIGLLWVASVLCACGDGAKSRAAANVHAILEARKFQRLLTQSERCPDTMPGWGRDDRSRRLVQTIRANGVLYGLRISCDDGRRFTVVLKYGMDSGTWITGSDKGSLEIMYGHFSDTRKLKILATDDPVAIANRVVNERW
jgi:hypothetical protein